MALCIAEADANKTTEDLAHEKEEQLLLEMERGQKKLAAVQDIAKGTVWTQSLKTSWRPPRFVRNMSEEEHQVVRDKHAILTEGEGLPPPITNFTVRQRRSR